MGTAVSGPRKELAAVLLTAVTLALPGCRRPEIDLSEKARVAIEADDYETAARLYREVTIAAPASPLAADALLELARIHYLRLRDVDAASDGLRKILGDHADTRAAAEARRLLARIYEEDLRDPGRALEQYRALLRVETDIARRRQTLLSIGDCLYRLDERDAAAEAYRAVLALPYHDSADAAYLRLAHLAELAGEPERGLSLLRELSRRTTSRERSEEAAATELRMLIDLGRFDDARAGLLWARESFPDSPEIELLESQFEQARRARRSLDGDDQLALLQEQQKRIRWGGGRRPRP